MSKEKLTKTGLRTLKPPLKIITMQQNGATVIVSFCRETINNPETPA